ncbi:MAG: DNA polymerase III subunit [Candidatus Latescibacteria bacterium]|nr:DNA polymerase III subunit [Candidatus Latescibacterota bacterium]
MSLSDLADQDRAKAVAASWLESGRIPHAILVCGAEGTGKRRFALELVKAVLCIEGSPFSCDQCPTCRKVDSLQHPDLHTAMPLPPRRGKREASPEALRDAVVEFLAGGATPPSNANIAVEHLRQLQKELSYSPTESPRKVGLLFAAERMHPAGANSLLKILEEPPARVVLVLVATAPERLLPTVLSRCQRLTLGPLSADSIRRQLELEGVVGERLELAVRMGAGSLQRAKEVAAGQFDEMRRLVEEFLAAGAAQQDEIYWNILDELGGDRGELEVFLLICGQYLRDLFLLAHGQGEAVVQVDRRAYLESASETIDAARAALEIDRAAETLANNASPQLVLTDLWRSLRRGGQASTMPPEASLAGARRK